MPNEIENTKIYNIYLAINNNKGQVGLKLVIKENIVYSISLFVITLDSNSGNIDCGIIDPENRFLYKDGVVIEQYSTDLINNWIQKYNATK